MFIFPLQENALFHHAMGLKLFKATPFVFTQSQYTTIKVA
jgi:hypothetical protein